MYCFSTVNNSSCDFVKMYILTAVRGEGDCGAGWKKIMGLSKKKKNQTKLTDTDNSDNSMLITRGKGGVKYSKVESGTWPQA